MFRLDSLGPDEYAKYWQTVRSSHLIRYTIITLDENEDELGSLTLPHESKLISGQRDIDTSQTPTRSLTIDVMDPHAEIALHPNHPSEFGIFMNRFLQVLRGVYVQGLQRWIDVPIFRGPVTKFTRDQERCHIEAKGKELLFVAPHLMWRVKSFKKGEAIIDVIKEIMQAKGERHFDFPDLDRPLPKHLSVGRHQEPWPVLKRLAHSLNRHLYYDGRGTAKLREYPHNPLHVFKDGVGGTLLSRPSFEYDHESVRNLVEVLGPKPSGKKQKRIRAIARLNERNPVSPESLAWNGEDRFLVESIDIDAPTPPDESDKEEKKQRIHEALVHRQRYAEELAKRRLKQLSMDSLTVQAEVVPLGDLEEFDSYALEWEGDHFEGRVTQTTLPFHSENMTLGFLRRVPIHQRYRKSQHKPRRDKGHD
jgi:hypothetical protein